MVFIQPCQEPDYSLHDEHHYTLHIHLACSGDGRYESPALAIKRKIIITGTKVTWPMKKSPFKPLPKYTTVFGIPVFADKGTSVI